MRRALILVGLLLCTASACSNAPGAFTYYEKGKFVTEPADTVRSREAAAVAAGEDRWRSEPAYVAAAMRPGLPKPGDFAPPLPTRRVGMAARRYSEEEILESLRLEVTPYTQRGRQAASVAFGGLDVGGLRTDYEVVEMAGDRAVVQASTKGEPQHRLVLQRPFGHWWYVTKIDPVLPTVNMLSAAGWVLEAEAQQQLSSNHWLFRVTDAGLGLSHDWYPPDYFVAWWHNDYYYGDLLSFGGRFLPFNAMFLRKGGRYVVVMDAKFRPLLFYPVDPKGATYVGTMTRLEFGDRARGAMDLREFMRGLLKGLRTPDTSPSRRRLEGALDRDRRVASQAFLTNPVTKDLRTEAPLLIHLLTLGHGTATVLVPLREPRASGGNVGILTLRRIYLTMGSPSWQITGLEVKQQEKLPDFLREAE